MKKIYFILLFFVLAGSASAQIIDALNRNPAENRAASDPKIRICAPSRAGIIANAPLFVVNKVVIENGYVMEYLSPSSIASFKVLKPDEGAKVYGESAKNGVIEVGFKSDVKLLCFTDLFKNYKIKKKYWALPVFIEDKKLTSSNDIYISSDVIKNVEVIKTGDKQTKDRFIKVSLKPL